MSTKRILSIHNGLPQGSLPLCWILNHPDPVHLWMAIGRKKLTHPLPEAGHSRRYLQNLWPFFFASFPPPPPCSIKEPGIQTPTRWSFWNISLPSSPSAGFLNKLLFFDSTPHLWFIGLTCGEERHLGLDNNITWSKAVWHKQHYVLKIINTSLSLKFRAVEGSDRRWLKNKAGSDPKRSYVSR